MGKLGDYFAQSFPPKPTFGVADIPDLEGKVIIVTGGNSGIGYEITKVLLSKNARVYMASRSQERAEAAIRLLQNETGKEAIFLKMDLSSLDSIRRATEEFQRKERVLHVLFNNGGVMNTPIDQMTVDGIDLQFGTNVVGHYLFTKRLMPLLIAGAEESGTKSRIVHTSSSAMMFADTVHLDAMKDPVALKKLGSGKMYMESKFGNVVLAKEFARRYADERVLSNSLNPGNLTTNITQHTPRAFMLFFGWLFSPAPMGALTPLYAGVSPETDEANGKYFIPWAREGKASAATDDKELGDRLWRWLEAECKE